MKLNCERGFWRMTLVISLLLFLPGACFVVWAGWEAWIRWNKAGGPNLDGPQRVFAFGLGGGNFIITVEPKYSYTEVEIKQVLDGLSEADFERIGRATVQALSRFSVPTLNCGHEPT